MSDPSYINPTIGIPLALILWVVLFIVIYGKSWKNKIDTYFSERRRQRREMNKLRNYMERDVKATVLIFDQQQFPAHRLRSVTSK